MGTESGPPQSGDRAPGVDEQVAGVGGEGSRKAAVTPPIADDQVADQTESPAPPDDVGVPADEEMNRPDA